MNPELTGRDGSAHLLNAAEEATTKLPPSANMGKEAIAEEDRLPEAPFSPIAWYVVVEIVRALGLLAEGLRRGEQERVTESRSIVLKALAEVATRWANDETWVMLRLSSRQLIALHGTACTGAPRPS